MKCKKDFEKEFESEPKDTASREWASWYGKLLKKETEYAKSIGIKVPSHAQTIEGASKQKVSPGFKQFKDAVWRDFKEKKWIN